MTVRSVPSSYARSRSATVGVLRTYTPEPPVLPTQTSEFADDGVLAACGTGVEGAGSGVGGAVGASAVG
jgi:hypothetical protein